jgi:hypothetical protein
VLVDDMHHEPKQPGANDQRNLHADDCSQLNLRDSASNSPQVSNLTSPLPRKPSRSNAELLCDPVSSRCRLHTFTVHFP